MDEASTKGKRIRRSSDQIRSEKISALEDKIAKKEQELSSLKEQLEELKRPPKLSAAEMQALLKEKIQSGALTEEEAYQLGYKG